jgi:hypothetical protein
MNADKNAIVYIAFILTGLAAGGGSWFLLLIAGTPLGFTGTFALLTGAAAAAGFVYLRAG